MFKWISLLCCAGLVFAQVQPVYRVGTRLVTVDVLVRTDKGAVKGLTKDDFTIQDKGKNQTIAVFAMTEAAGGPGAKQDALPENVASNRMNNGGDVAQTATVILMDRLNTPSSADQATMRSKILTMLTTLKPTDRVGFYSLGTNLSLVQDFNDNADALIQAAKRAGSGGAAASDPRGQQLDAAMKEALTPIQQQDLRVRVPTTQQALQAIARHLAGIPGRKNLIWVLSEFPLTYGEDASRRSNYEAEVGRATEIMSEANVAVYPMDPRGVTTSNASAGSTNDNTAAANSAGKLMPGANRSGGAAGTSGGLGQSGMETFDTIGKSTGGATFRNSNDLGGDVRKVLAEAEVTYTLGFYVDEKSLDGKSHDLTVKLVKKAETNGATPRFKKSYLATQTAQQQRPALNELIGDPLDATAVGIMAATAPDPAKPGFNAVQVRVSLGDIQFERKADKWVAAIDLGMAIEGLNGKATNAVTVPTNLSLTDEQLKQGLGSGLIIDSAAPTPAQPSRLRVVVQDKSSGSAGSVRIPISK
jgi:VWFA-related protein